MLRASKFIFSTIFVFFLNISCLNAMECTDFGDFKSYGGHYYAISGSKYTFAQAKQIAENNNGYIAIPNDSSENNFLATTFGTGWIGVYDPNYTQTGLCYYGNTCATNSSRFVTVKNTALTYFNWASGEPSNSVFEYDIVNGKSLVAPLGEHWTVIGQNGTWGDFGNHASENNNPIQFKAIMEFDTKPECVDDSNTSELLLGKKCIESIYNTGNSSSGVIITDNTGDTLITSSNTYDCQADQYGNEFCPSQLAKCDSIWGYDNGYSTEHSICPDENSILDSNLKRCNGQFGCQGGVYNSKTTACDYNTTISSIVNANTYCQGTENLISAPKKTSCSINVAYNMSDPSNTFNNTRIIRDGTTIAVTPTYVTKNVKTYSVTGYQACWEIPLVNPACGWNAGLGNIKEVVAFDGVNYHYYYTMYSDYGYSYLYKVILQKGDIYIGQHQAWERNYHQTKIDLKNGMGTAGQCLKNDNFTNTHRLEDTGFCVNCGTNQVVQTISKINNKWYLNTSGALNTAFDITITDIGSGTYQADYKLTSASSMGVTKSTTFNSVLKDKYSSCSKYFCSEAKFEIDMTNLRLWIGSENIGDENYRKTPFNLSSTSVCYSQTSTTITAPTSCSSTAYPLTDTQTGMCYANPNTYYTYHCSTTPNEYGQTATVINPGGTTSTDSTPPANNCKTESFSCVPASDRKCAYISGEWKCSPFPCFGESNLENADTTVGATDSTNKGFNNDGSCSYQIRLFNGKDKRCRSWDILFGLMGGGCCQKEKSGGSLGSVFASQCTDDEKLLSKYRKETNDKSVEIGEYCSKYLKLGFAKICTQKKKTYCVFNSKLARIIHQQGRPQLGIEWGSPKAPNCRGFTPEEFQKIDFSKLDLSEFYGDLQSKIQTTIDAKIGTTIQQKVQSFGVNVSGGSQ